MPIIINTYTGPSKRELVEAAFRKCGVRNPDPTDLDDGLRELNELLADWLGQGLDLEYAAPASGPGGLDDLSNIAVADSSAVIANLSLRLLPTLGQQIHPQQAATAARSFALLQGRYACVPCMGLPCDVSRGQGSRYGRGGYGW